VEEQHEPEGRPLDLDADAASAEPSLPAFLARPEGAPVYHGFRLIDEVEVGGFRLGAISSFGSDVGSGDAFIVAPDDSRAGLVWQVSDAPYLREIRGFEDSRWGVWEVSFPRAVSGPQNAEKALADIVPRLRPHWEAWREWRRR